MKMEFIDFEYLTEISWADTQDKDSLAIAASVDKIRGMVVIVTAALTVYEIPMCHFTPNADTAPDFDALYLSDYGHTIGFGHYEADVEYAIKSVAE